jgi:hypothetical protein
MDANIFLGWALLALALATGSVFAAIILAASKESESRAGRPLYGRRTRGAFSKPGTGPRAVSLAHCYYDCMSGFHWSSDWDRLCGEACSVGGRLPKG